MNELSKKNNLTENKHIYKNVEFRSNFAFKVINY